MRALIFDLDGTLVDTVCAHVLAWQGAFTELGLTIDAWRIHRRIGACRGLSARTLTRESEDPDTPMIMVGPGTGIAPFRAFLQERKAIGARAKTWLFFGSQREQCDHFTGTNSIN